MTKGSWPVGRQQGIRHDRGPVRRNVTLYLSGSVRRGLNDQRLNAIAWDSEDESQIRAILSDMDITIHNPASTTIDRSDALTHFSADLSLIEASDFMITNGTASNGVGTGAEMMWAAMMDVPVITVAPRNSQYRRDEIELCGQRIQDWVHPFVFALSCMLAESLEDALRAVRDCSRHDLIRMRPFIGESSIFHGGF